MNFKHLYISKSKSIKYIDIDQNILANVGIQQMFFSYLILGLQCAVIGTYRSIIISCNILCTVTN